MLEIGKFYRFKGAFKGAGVILRHSSIEPDRVFRGMEFSGGHLESIEKSYYTFARIIGSTKYYFTVPKHALKIQYFVESKPPNER